MKIFLALLGIIAGIFYLKYNYQVTNMLGRFTSIEEKLGPGGTFLFHKILAVVLIVVSIMYAFGSLQNLLQDTVGPFFSAHT